MKTRIYKWLLKAMLPPLICLIIWLFMEPDVSPYVLLAEFLAWVFLWGLYEIWNTLEDIKEILEE